MSGVKKYIGVRAHVEICRGSEEENKLYCVKDGKVLLEVGIYNTSIGQRGCPSSMGDNVIELIDFLKSGKTIADIEPQHYLTFVCYGNMIMKIVNAHVLKMQMNEMRNTFEKITWKHWQLDLIEYLKCEVDDRKVRWYVDPKGGQGKTFISKYLVSNGDCVRFENGKSADIKYGYTGQRCVLFDLSRSQMDHVNYEVIESVKNGIVYNTKYQSEMRVYKVTHVIVMSNEKPDESKLSRDRWDIIELLQATACCRVEPMEHISEEEQARRDEIERQEQDDRDLLAMAVDDSDDTDDGLPAFHFFNARR